MNTPAEVIGIKAFKGGVFAFWQENDEDVVQIYDETCAALDTIREPEIVDISANSQYIVISGTNSVDIVKQESMQRVQSVTCIQPILKAKINEDNVLVIANKSGDNTITLTKITLVTPDAEDMNVPPERQSHPGTNIAKQLFKAATSTEKASDLIKMNMMSTEFDHVISKSLNLQSSKLHEMALAQHNIFVALSD